MKVLVVSGTRFVGYEHPPTDRPAAYAGRTRERELALRLA